MLLILALALFPSTASANAGTPLMWASMLHLVFGNAIIGLIEGLLLARLFKCSKRKSILTLIAANTALAGAVNASFNALNLPQFSRRAPTEQGRSDIMFDGVAFIYVAPAVTEVVSLPLPVNSLICC